MNRWRGGVLAGFSAVALALGVGAPVSAQSSMSSGSSWGGDQPVVDTPAEGGVDDLPVTGGEIDGPFAAWGIQTPPGAESYVVNSASEDELHPQGLAEWHPTVDPEAEVVPGQMRSDEEAVPAGVSKEEADLAETKEARLQDGDGPSLQARAGCGVYWPAKFEVCGAIKARYDQLRGPQSFLMFPTSNEMLNGDGVGWRQNFMNGSIWWHPRVGAHTVSLPVSKVWQRHGFERGFLGYPTSGDVDLGNQWFKQSFEGGYVYTHNAVPASQASIQGAIYDKWQALGGENSELGFPISDELPTPDGVGRYNVFEGGMIYWTPQYGAQKVSGLTLSVWATNGFETGKYGFPTSDSYIAENGETIQKFERSNLNITQEIRRAGNVLINGESVNALLARFLASRPSVSMLPNGFSAPSLQASNGSDNGGVSIPERYDYDPSQGSLRDYCTKSPDYYSPPDMVAADFRGACARHDICYFDQKYGGNPFGGYADCNRKFKSDLNTVCDNVYEGYYARRMDCRFVADSYYEVVVAVHPSQWPGHVVS